MFVLSGQKLTFSVFLQLAFYLRVRSLTNVAISQLTGVSENTISEWKAVLHTQVADFLVANPSSIGGPGVIVEMDEAKFGKRKYSIISVLIRLTNHGTLSAELPCPRTGVSADMSGFLETFQ